MKSKKTHATLDAAGIRARVVAWFRLNGRDLPWRRTHDPYSILVSEFMLQQTQVATVIDYYERWMGRFPNFRALAAAGETEVMQAWAGLGYYSRVRNLHRAAQQVVAEHGGELPNRLKPIAALPGVGPYTAGAVASFAFDRATPVVDTNVARVLARILDLRLPIDSAPGRETIWTTARALLPLRRAGEYNSALMELGALICTSRKPRCLLCPIRGDCATQDPESIPVKKPRRKRVILSENCAWITRNGMVLLEQQTGRRWHALWKLPIASESHSSEPLVALAYAFTHHRVDLRVDGEAARPARGSERWFPVETLRTIGLPAAHRRALNRLLLLDC